MRETVTCATCGGEAARVAWSVWDAAEHYRCGECHAGGHAVRDGDETVKQGGVFERLNNWSTRQVSAL